MTGDGIREIAPFGAFPFILLRRTQITDVGKPFMPSGMLCAQSRHWL